MQKIKAVITADVVNSSLLDKNEMSRLKRWIEKTLHKMNIPFSFYRGDSLVFVCDREEALRTIVLLRTFAIQMSDENGLRSIDIRMALGVGWNEEPFRELSTAKGEAFVLSGRELDNMEKHGPRLTIRCGDPVIDAGMSAVALFTDYILRNLTKKQAEVVHELLNGKTQVMAAKRLKRTQSTIHKHAKAAQWKELIILLDLYATLVNNFTGTEKK